MADIGKKCLLRGALCFALAIIFQGLRIIIPMPPVAGMFLIGSLVNMSLLLALEYAGLTAAVFIGALLPVAAFLQGQLSLPLLIPIVICGNVTLILLYNYVRGSFFVWSVPFAKTAVLTAGTMLLLNWLAIPEELAAMLLFMMSWPQIITGIIGICLVRNISRRLPL